MIVANFITERAAMGSTRTYEDFYKFLGAKPHKLGVITRLYPHLTASYLTESLKNIVYRDAKAKDKFTPIDSLYFEWNIDVNQITRPRLINFEGDGTFGSEIIMQFDTKWYDKFDTFVNESTRQQFLVLSNPIRKGDNAWEVVVRIIDSDIRTTLDAATQVGDVTHWIANAHPELHDEGHIKYQSNFEKARNYITTFRVDDSFSSLYALHEDQFVKIAEGKGEMKESYYKMDKKEKVLLDNFLTARNQGLLFNKSNIDLNGRANIQDPATNRPVPIGEGIIPQVERYADKYGYTKMTREVFNTVLRTMNKKSEKSTGNHYLFILNDKAWEDIQYALGDMLIHAKADASYLYSKASNGYVKVGTTFNAYEFAGNHIEFRVDKTFSLEFGDEKGYALCLDLTGDLTSGHAPIEMFTLKGKDIVTNKFVGVGGLNGGDSGEVSSPVAGSRLIIHGYAGIGVFAPHKSFILREL